MNLQHLKFAVEVAQTHSFSETAKKLNFCQPYISKAIRELEHDLGIEIFERTPLGVFPTQEGIEFLVHAQSLLNQIKQLEERYKSTQNDNCYVKITVPSSCYLTQAFAFFMEEVVNTAQSKVDYLEVNGTIAMDRVASYGSNIGIIRYQEEYENYFLSYVERKNLRAQPLWCFMYRLLFHRDNPLVYKENIQAEDLKNLVEIRRDEQLVIPLSDSEAQELKEENLSTSKFVVCERQSQFELLCRIPQAYMWTDPVPGSVLKRYPIVQRTCKFSRTYYKDVLIYRKGYQLTGEDCLFIRKIQEQIAEHSENEEISVQDFV